jgi:hypothetical protein
LRPIPSLNDRWQGCRRPEKHNHTQQKTTKHSVSKNRQQASGVEVAWIRVRVRVFHQQPFM